MLAYLGSVGQEYGRGQVAGDAAQDVNDGDAQPASQLLQVPQDGHLESHRHQAVEDPGGGGGAAGERGTRCSGVRARRHVCTQWKRTKKRRAARVEERIPARR